MKKVIGKLTRFGAAFALSISSLLIINFGTAHAVLPAPDGGTTCVWQGTSQGGDGHTFADALNWLGCTGGGAPQALDDLQFDNSGWSGNQNLVDDLTVHVGQVSFIGTSAHSLTISPDVANDNLFITKGVINNTSGASLEFDGPVTLNNDQTLTGASISNQIILGSPTTPSTVSIGTSNITVDNVDVSINDAMDGIGAITVNSSLSLNGDNTYGGAATVSSGGLLTLQNAHALGTGSVTVSSGGSLKLFFGSNVTISNNITLSGTGLDASTGTLVASGLAPASITLSGTLTLNSNVTYSGSQNTTVTGTFTSNGHSISVLAGNAGKITTSAGTSSAPVQTITIPASDTSNAAVAVGYNQTYIIDGQRGATTVQTGGTLMGTGTVGDLNVQTGGTVAPGHSPGCLNTGNLTITGSYDAEIGGTTACTGYDQIKVAGTATTVDLTSGTLNTSLYNGFKPAAGDSFTIIDNGTTNAVTGTFTGLPEGATFTVSGYVFQISYTGGDGNDVVLTVQSVPATPDTGFSLITNNPLASAAGTIMAAAGFYALYRKKAFATTRR